MIRKNRKQGQVNSGSCVKFVKKQILQILQQKYKDIATLQPKNGFLPAE